MQEQLQRAIVLLEQGRAKDAKKVLIDVLAQDPNNPDILSLLAQVELSLENNEEALKFIEKAINLEPDNAIYFEIKGRIHLTMENNAKAKSALSKAIELDPYNDNAFAYLAHILVYEKKFQEALEMANESLAINAENLFALNVRSTAQLKLGHKEESYKTIEGALREDPENSYTHSNYGWGLLEKGEGKKSMEHFKEALRLNPNNDHAKAGMAEALKANYWLYRQFLKYSFWMAKMAAKNQWIFIIAFYFGYKLISSFAKANPEWAFITTPLLILLALVAFSTWILNPLFNLFLRTNAYGRHLLDEEDTKNSNLVGASLAIGVIGLIGYFATKEQWLLYTGVYGVAMMIPFSRFFSRSKTKNLFKVYGGGLAIVGFLGILSVLLNAQALSIFVSVFILGFIAYQWVANYQVIE